MSLTANNSGGSKSQRIASQRKVLDEASRKRRARKGILKYNIDNMTSRYQLIFHFLYEHYNNFMYNFF